MVKRRNQGSPVVIQLPFLFSVLIHGPWRTVDGFHQRHLTPWCSTRPQFIRPMTIDPLNIFTYRRGADIWPECNEDPVQLRDSFPNGQIPYSAIMAMDQQDMAAVHNSIQESIFDVPSAESEIVETGKKGKRRRAARFFVSKTVRRLLRRAAAREELDTEQAALDATPGIWNKALGVLAIALLMKRMLGPMDILWVVSLTAYYIILTMVARSPREGGLAPIMPAMPPQGHVPIMVSNPLGIGTLYSTTYDIWLKIGIVVGLVAPLIQWVDYVFRTDNIAAAQLCASPMFLLCCQALNEAHSRRVMAPLPIRILVPISYNAARLGYLWNWACTTKILGLPGRALAIGNFVYWTTNLLAFLIPVALVRYMRAHFFAVEAAEVTTRIGMEDSVGLVSNMQ